MLIDKRNNRGPQLILFFKLLFKSCRAIWSESSNSKTKITEAQLCTTHYGKGCGTFGYYSSSRVRE
jgi:hypothetical protein